MDFEELDTNEPLPDQDEFEHDIVIYWRRYYSEIFEKLDAHELLMLKNNAIQNNHNEDRTYRAEAFVGAPCCRTATLESPSMTGPTANCGSSTQTSYTADERQEACVAFITLGGDDER